MGYLGGVRRVTVRKWLRRRHAGTRAHASPSSTPASDDPDRRSRSACTAATSSTATRTAWRSASAASCAPVSAPPTASTCAAPDNDPDDPTSPGERFGFVYEINYLRCIHCDLCVEACPTEAITESKLFEFSFTNRAGRHLHQGRAASSTTTASPSSCRGRTGDAATTVHQLGVDARHRAVRRRRLRGHGRPGPASWATACARPARHDRGGVRTGARGCRPLRRGPRRAWSRTTTVTTTTVTPPSHDADRSPPIPRVRSRARPRREPAQPVCAEADPEPRRLRPRASVSRPPNRSPRSSTHSRPGREPTEAEPATPEGGTRPGRGADGRRAGPGADGRHPATPPSTAGFFDAPDEPTPKKRGSADEGRDVHLRYSPR